MIMSLGVG